MSPSAEQGRSAEVGAVADASGSGNARCPAGVAVTALGIGILSDRFFSPGWEFWTIMAISTLVLAVAVNGRSARNATLFLLASCLAVGGMRHHLSWSASAVDDVARLARQTQQPVRVIGVLRSPPAIITADDSELTPPWMRVDRTVSDLACEQLLCGDKPVPISGTARLMITGHVLHVDVGDRVEVVGQISRPRGTSNPGAFDYQDYLRRQGIRCVISCDHPDAVRVVKRYSGRRLSRLRAELRAECEAILVEHLDPSHVALASSLLLGLRSQLPEDIRTAFAESGTMHVLAISGLHVGILAGLLLIGCRLLNVSVPATTVVLLLGIGGYAFVTNLRPPVVRASVLAVVAAAAWPSDRRVSGPNLIAICALVVLLIDPTDLFETGTQLSFLAVAAIGWAASFITSQRRRIDTESLLPRLMTNHESGAATLLRILVGGYVVTAAIWIFTLPLTIARFHIVAPIGFLINVLLIPYVALLLAFGFVTVACGLLVPSLAHMPAVLFDVSLGWLLGVVDSASSLHLGHRYVAGPPEWWLIGFYAILGILLLFRSRPIIGRWGWAGVWSWVILGLGAAYSSPHRESLRCLFLDMGHGCCVILELPEGKNLLYDAGLLGNQNRGRRIVQAALWERGIRQIDGIVVSHADVDHFNVAAPLLKTMPTGTLIANRSFLDFTQPAVDVLCETAHQQRVPIRLVQSGDRLMIGDPRISLDVLQPARDWKGGSDNANSVVLRVEFAGRSLLLAGDLEGAGLGELLNRLVQPVDVLLAPHHGSRAANPPSLAHTADPAIVIVSGGDESTSSTLQSIYTNADQILCTRQDGAITVEISESGAMSATPFIGNR